MPPARMRTRTRDGSGSGAARLSTRRSPAAWITTVLIRPPVFRKPYRMAAGDTRVGPGGRVA